MIPAHPRWVAAAATLVTLMLASAARAQVPPPIIVNRLPASLAGEWLFRVGHDPAFASPFREVRNWQRIHVPGSWEKQGWPGYDGHAWYRESLFISSELEGADFGLDLGRIGDVDEVFLNGRKVGATGSFPPQYDKATLARRFYLVPRETLRFGQYNELAIHVYNDSRFGGLLGPSPQIDAYQAILGREVLRDVGAYCLATLLLTLATFQLVLFFAQRDALEHLGFAGFLAAVALMFLTFTHWGPSMLLGHSATFRINVTSLLLAVALFPAVPFRLARRRQPVALFGAETLLALGAVFALVWRDEADLYLWIFAAEATILLAIAMTLRLGLTVLRRRRPWGTALLVSSSVLSLLAFVDILCDLGLLPRFRFLVGEMLTPIGLVPFALSFSNALAFSWVERRWGEPLDPATGLMSRDRFVDRLNSEMQRWRGGAPSVAVALLRIGVSEAEGDRERPAASAVMHMRKALRQIDLLARYDPDTFILLLADTEERAAMSILERLRRSVAEHVGGVSHVRTTAGVAQYRPGRHLAAEELLQEAEAALYAALSEGGDCTATAP
ncbi:MAG: diguanylate cyclase domain-containing protein [Thermoanaerobaculales bacterium]